MLAMTKNSNRGFSLIELMVTVVVLAIVASFAIPSFRELIANTQIRTTAESIRNGLQIARSEAVKRNATVTFTLANNTSWTVGCATVTANCPAIIQEKTATEGSSTTVALALTGLNTISFTSLGTVTPAAGQLSQVDVDNSAIASTESKDLRITIGVGGGTRVCDPNVSDPSDSRHC